MGMRPGPAVGTLFSGVVVASVAVVMAMGSGRTGGITIEYPERGSIFPPEITAPTFLWLDGTSHVDRWRIDISFADGSAEIHAVSQGAPPHIGKIDPDCVTDTNEPPKLSPPFAGTHSWTPDPVMWAAIKRHSVTTPATVSIAGLSAFRGGAPLSHGAVTIQTSKDPVGAPIFYRDVPLMPSEVKPGVIKPLAQSAVPLIKWRLRNIAESSGRVVMEGQPMCANCHSFSADGKTLGMDMDGLQNNRGLYILARLAPQTTVDTKDMVRWRTAKGPLKGAMRIGFMSQVSPDGRFVATTIDPLQLSAKGELPSNYYVANFKDYRFLQVFYPTRGILSWYSKATGVLQPLPGADDPRFVQMEAVWSPGGQYLVFGRAKAQDPYPPGVPLARFANDPNETQVHYDLYRIPFRDGQGGTPEPIQGASRNGMSNSFAKVSPDGKWIVFVEARNGLLMRPDSQLFIVPAAGGVARRMNCNTKLMNSWHSFSPNGRWLVFSSKVRSPYTQLYLTHIDEQGNDSPAILIDNTTASNRAANIPEFVNIPPDGLQHIGGPALEFYQIVNRAMYLQKNKRPAEAIGVWRQAIAMRPDDPTSHQGLGDSLMMVGRPEEAGPEIRKGAELKWRAALADDPSDFSARHHLGKVLIESGEVQDAAAQLTKAVALEPSSAPAHCDLGTALMRLGNLEGALAEEQKALQLDARYAPAHYDLGLLMERKGESGEAIGEWQKALETDPHYVEAHDRLADALYGEGRVTEALAQWRDGTNGSAELRQQAWILATNSDPSIRNGKEAVELAVRAVELSHGKDAGVWDALAAAYAETGQFDDAVQTAQHALQLAEQGSVDRLTQAIRSRMRLYEARTAFREASPVAVESHQIPYPSR